MLSAAATDDTGDDASNNAKCWNDNENDNQPSSKGLCGLATSLVGIVEILVRIGCVDAVPSA